MPLLAMKPSAYVKGALTYVLPSTVYSRSTGGTVSARYCYSVFLRHLVKLREVVPGDMPHTVAELGPGDSIGIGLAALLAGAERYYGFDVCDFAAVQRNLVVFDELVDLFRRREPIPDDDEFPDVNPVISDYGFPAEILSESALQDALAPERIQTLREDLARGGIGQIQYLAPWFDQRLVRSAEIDWIFSQAVLEHVDDLETTYEAFATWLKPNGLMTHQIDFKSHNLSHQWNGHWACSSMMWRLVRGRRPYLLNRQPVSTHLGLLRTNRFEIVADHRVIQEDGVSKDELLDRYTGLDDETLKTSGSFIVAQLA